MDSHKIDLSNVCRICAEAFPRDKKGRHNLVCNNVKNIETAFWLENVENDKPEVHPPEICDSCYYTMKNINNGKSVSKITPFDWYPHHNGCMICYRYTIKQAAGRRPTKRKSKGRPRASDILDRSKIWTREVTVNLRESTAFENDVMNYSDYDLAVNISLPLCQCAMCEGILQRPVVLNECQHAFCLSCLAKKFEGRDDIECPSCSTKFSPTLIKPCTVRTRLIQTLVLKCRCGLQFKNSKLLDEHKKDCVGEKEGSLLTVHELLELDLDECPIPATVEQATLKILKHKIDSSENGTAEFPSGGPRPRVFMSTPKPVKPTAECSSRHQRRRNKGIRKSIEFASKTTISKQMASLSKFLPKNQRKDFLEEIGFGRIEIDEKKMLSLKISLGMPWEKLKKIGRFLSQHNIKTGGPPNAKFAQRTAW
ncbi:V(D)J recombination-activating protein 1-like [Clytia hemisphaerica]|uniref:V(D)J recombination-activating protein 1-like n=1 Tax=Clytia hemisphaerica TaxID=252671 RepID=UPI0034D45D36